jgi:hypothetical protein
MFDADNPYFGIFMEMDLLTSQNNRKNKVSKVNKTKKAKKYHFQ